MSGLHSRNKGKAGEREVRDLFRRIFEGHMDDVEDIRRNHQQAEIGGADLVGLPFFSVEIKRVKQIAWGKGLMDWWGQCVEQASNDKKAPLLLFRQDHGKWFVMFYAQPILSCIEHGKIDDLQCAYLYPSIMMWEQFSEMLKTALEMKERK